MVLWSVTVPLRMLGAYQSPQLSLLNFNECILTDVYDVTECTWACVTKERYVESRSGRLDALTINFQDYAPQWLRTTVTDFGHSALQTSSREP